TGCGCATVTRKCPCNSSVILLLRPTRDASSDCVAVTRRTSASFLASSRTNLSISDERPVLIDDVYVVCAVFVGRDRVELVEAVQRPNIVTGTDIILIDDGDWPNLYWTLTSICASHAQAERGWNEILGGPGQAAVACGDDEWKDEQQSFHYVDPHFSGNSNRLAKRQSHLFEETGEICSDHHVLLLTRRRWRGGNRYRREVTPDFAGTDVVCCAPATVQSCAGFAMGKPPTWLSGIPEGRLGRLLRWRRRKEGSAVLDMM